MIDHSFLRMQIQGLRELFGEENVRLSSDKRRMLVRKIPVPVKLAKVKKRADICIEIPDGYGFGSEILTVFVYLPVSSYMSHLYPAKSLKGVINREFGERWTDDFCEWFWICFHPLESEYREMGEDEIKSQTMKIKEIVYMVSIVLDEIAENNKTTLSRLAEMTVNREKILKNHENEIKLFIETLEWKTFRWPHREATWQF
jgi:hypothetical protein